MTDMIVLTFDNFGEAAEIEQGTWPAGAPRGRHPSVTQVLPRLLDLLDAIALRATLSSKPSTPATSRRRCWRSPRAGTSSAFTPGATSAGATFDPTPSRPSSTAALRPTSTSASTYGRSGRPAAG